MWTNRQLFSRCALRRFVLALAVLAIGVTLLPQEVEAKNWWKLKAGYKRMIKPSGRNLFRLEWGSDYQIVGPLYFSWDSGLEVNGDFLNHQAQIGLKVRIKATKVLRVTFRGAFIFDTGVTFDPVDSFFGLGGLFGPGIVIQLGGFGISFEVTAEVGKLLSVDALLVKTTGLAIGQSPDRSPLFWGMNFMMGIEF